MPNARNFKVTHPIYAIGKIENKGIIQSQESQKERGQLAVFYTSPKSFIITFFLFVGVTTFGTSVNFDCFVHKVECSNVLTTNFNLQKE